MQGSHALELAVWVGKYLEISLVSIPRTLQQHGLVLSAASGSGAGACSVLADKSKGSWAKWQQSDIRPSALILLLVHIHQERRVPSKSLGEPNWGVMGVKDLCELHHQIQNTTAPFNIGGLSRKIGLSFLHSSMPSILSSAGHNIPTNKLANKRMIVARIPGCSYY